MNNHLSDTAYGDSINAAVPELSSDNINNQNTWKTIDKTHPQHWCGQHNFEVESLTNFYDYSNVKNKKKSAMCQIAEIQFEKYKGIRSTPRIQEQSENDLNNRTACPADRKKTVFNKYLQIARFNKIRHVYDLQDESGPAHKKLFTVKLILTPSETFEGSGTSIKRAQQASAEIALRHTTLPLPAEKPARKKPNDAIRPDRVLQNVCRSLQYTMPHYVLCNPPVYPDPGSPIPEHILIPLSASVMYGPQLPNSPIDPMRPLGPKLQVVLVNINGKSISTGVGESYPLAKQDAASKALTALSPILKEHQARILDSSQEFFQEATSQIPKHKQKSVISDIHEKAHQLQMNVVFEVMKEDGPPHDRQYIVRCAFVAVDNKIKAEAIGKGKKKKTAQQEACTHLLKIVRHMGTESNPIILASNICKTEKKLASLNKEPKRRTIVKDKKMDPLYGHQINPVSRLIQIMQTKNYNHPTFELVSENGLSKYKEFIIRVKCGENICEGKGPNKRLAKRAAAEAMLETIGFVKPLPSPGKSLLKKNENAPIGNQLITMNILPNRSTVETDSTRNRAQEKEKIDLVPDTPQADDRKFDISENEKRRVTFNSQVHACPPPGDEDYPNSIVTQLKKDAIVEGKIRRLKRTKENRRALSAEQISKLANCANAILSDLNNAIRKNENSTAFHQLGELSVNFKFGVQYTTFPEASPSQHFTIVSLGLEDPLVGHGTGRTTSEADENAALAALIKLKDLA